MLPVLKNSISKLQAGIFTTSTVINASAAVTLLEQRPEKNSQVSVLVVLRPHLH